ncbi:hypothetical protein QWZ13_08535 [Reinekea marina]|nr:hypothetical protein [Reinekea marina]MDN3648956.1 hypothetical protein [Reinekea marina]
MNRFFTTFNSALFSSMVRVYMVKMIQKSADVNGFTRLTILT